MILKDPPKPGTPQWRGMITASKAPSMFRDASGEYMGLGYLSAYETWLSMRGVWEPSIPPDLQELFDDGHDIEDYAVNYWLRRNPGWRQSRKEVTYTDPSWKVPNLATIDRRVSRGSRRAIIECKRPVRAKPQLPAGWYVQVMTQMMISGIREAYLVEVPRFGDPTIHTIYWDPEVAKKIREDCEHFHNLVIDDTPPDIGASKSANEILADRFPNPTGETIELDVDTMEDLVIAWQEVEIAEAKARILENRLKERMGDASKLLFGGVPVIRRSAGRFAQSRIPKEHREVLRDPEFMSQKFDPALLKKKMPDVYEAALGAAGFTVERAKWLK